MRTPRLVLISLINRYRMYASQQDWIETMLRILKLRAHAEDGYCPHDWHGYYDDVGGSG